MTEIEIMDSSLGSTNRTPYKGIYDLPNEIVHQICLYMDVPSLKQFSVTCRRVADIIATSKKILKKFKLKLTKEFMQSPTDLPNFIRKYTNIEITDVVDSHSILCGIFKKIGSDVLTLTIEKSTLDDFTFLTILRSCSVLEELCMSEVVIERKLPAIRPYRILHLTSVTIHHTNWLVFQFLMNSKINSLHINSYLNEGEGTKVHLVRMLDKRCGLRKLMLFGTSSRTLFRDNDLNDIWNHELSTFHIGCCFGKNSDDVNRNIISFLTMNNETLRSVKISLTNSEQITAFALLNLPNVTSLILEVNRLPNDHTFKNRLVTTGQNRLLKHLKLTGYYRQSALVKAILKRYPAVTYLELDDCSNVSSESNMLQFVSKNFRQLEKLSIPEISNCCNQVVFHALKKLQVDRIRDAQNLITFVRRNNSMEMLKVNLVHVEQFPCIGNLVDRIQIQHLTLAGCIRSLRMILDLVERNTPRAIKTLELRQPPYGNCSALRKAIKIQFPTHFDDLRTKLDAFF